MKRMVFVFEGFDICVPWLNGTQLEEVVSYYNLYKSRNFGTHALFPKTYNEPQTNKNNKSKSTTLCLKFIHASQTQIL